MRSYEISKAVFFTSEDNKGKPFSINTPVLPLNLLKKLVVAKFILSELLLFTEIVKSEATSNFPSPTVIS